MSVDRPFFTLKVTPPGASSSPVDVTELIISMTYDDEEAKADKLTLTLDNFDLSLFDDANWKRGNVLEVAWGYVGNVCPPRQCIIQKISGAQVLTVEALAKSILMHKLTKSRVFDAMKRSDVVASVATEEGYDSAHQFIDDTEVVLPHIQQAKMTNAEFVRHLAQKEGFHFWVGPDGLHFERRKMSSAPILTYTYYLDRTGTLMDFHVENDGTKAPGSVKAAGRDPLKKTDISSSSTDATVTRDGVAPLLEVVDPTTKTTQTVALAQDTTLATSAASADAAKREADGKFIQGAQSTVILGLTLVGDPSLFAKRIVVLQGISKRFSGKYYVKQVKHSLSAEKYEMSANVRSDGGHGGAGQPATPPSSAAPNTKDSADPNALVPIETVDPTTGLTVTTYQRP